MQGENSVPPPGLLGTTFRGVQGRGFRWLILNTRSVERIPKKIKHRSSKLSFLRSRWRYFSGNLSIESDEKGVHDRMMWVDGSGTSKRGLEYPRAFRFWVPGRDYREGVNPSRIDGLMISLSLNHLTARGLVGLTWKEAEPW